jgi:hypothetical protein
MERKNPSLFLTQSFTKVNKYSVLLSRQELIGGKNFNITSIIWFQLAYNFFSFLLCGTGVWTQGLHLEPLHQPFFKMGFFEIGSWELFAWGWFQTAILIAASWVARITGMSPPVQSIAYKIYMKSQRIIQAKDMTVI